jgi:hypothetical protein
MIIPAFIDTIFVSAWQMIYSHELITRDWKIKKGDWGIMLAFQVSDLEG